MNPTTSTDLRAVLGTELYKEVQRLEAPHGKNKLQRAIDALVGHFKTDWTTNAKVRDGLDKKIKSLTAALEAAEGKPDLNRTEARKDLRFRQDFAKTTDIMLSVIHQVAGKTGDKSVKALEQDLAKLIERNNKAIERDSQILGEPIRAGKVHISKRMPGAKAEPILRGLGVIRGEPTQITTIDLGEPKRAPRTELVVMIPVLLKHAQEHFIELPTSLRKIEKSHLREMPSPKLREVANELIRLINLDALDKGTPVSKVLHKDLQAIRGAARELPKEEKETPMARGLRQVVTAKGKGSFTSGELLSRTIDGFLEANSAFMDKKVAQELSQIQKSARKLKGKDLAVATRRAVRVMALSYLEENKDIPKALNEKLYSLQQTAARHPKEQLTEVEFEDWEKAQTAVAKREKTEAQTALTDAVKLARQHGGEAFTTVLGQWFGGRSTENTRLNELRDQTAVKFSAEGGKEAVTLIRKGFGTRPIPQDLQYALKLLEARIASVDRLKDSDVFDLLAKRELEEGSKAPREVGRKEMASRVKEFEEEQSLRTERAKRKAEVRATVAESLPRKMVAKQQMDALERARVAEESETKIKEAGQLRTERFTTLSETQTETASVAVTKGLRSLLDAVGKQGFRQFEKNMIKSADHKFETNRLTPELIAETISSIVNAYKSAKAPIPPNVQALIQEVRDQAEFL